MNVVLSQARQDDERNVPGTDGVEPHRPYAQIAAADEADFCVLAAPAARKELEPWVRESRCPPTTNFNCFVGLMMLINRPLFRLLPRRVLRRCLSPFWAHYILLGGELRIGLLIQMAGFDQRDGVDDYRKVGAKIVDSALARLASFMQVWDDIDDDR